MLLNRTSDNLLHAVLSVMKLVVLTCARTVDIDLGEANCRV